MNDSTNDRDFDLVVCGSCTVDVLVRGVDLAKPIGVGQLHRVDPITLSVGGMVSNAAITAARLGLSVAGFSAVGKDTWGDVVLSAYEKSGVDKSFVSRHDQMPTSTTVVMVDPEGQRSFVHSQGAPKAMTADDYFNALPLFANSRAMLLGYYPLLPNMLENLADIFAAIKETGCMTALDAAGGGGTMDPLAQVLPHLDVYCPSFDEAKNQTGKETPQEILQVYRDCGATGLLGVKLGSAGAMLSPAVGEFISIEAAVPSRVIDTTGAGDVFFAALLSAILKGCNAQRAGEIAARTAARSITAMGATTAQWNWGQVSAPI